MPRACSPRSPPSPGPRLEAGGGRGGASPAAPPAPPAPSSYSRTSSSRNWSGAGEARQGLREEGAFWQVTQSCGVLTSRWTGRRPPGAAGGGGRGRWQRDKPPNKPAPSPSPTPLLSRAAGGCQGPGCCPREPLPPAHVTLA